MKKLSLSLVAVALLAGCKGENPMDIAEVAPEEKAKIEACIDVLWKKAFVDNAGSMVIVDNDKEYTLSQKEALKISKNWNYEKLMSYYNDDVLHNFEKDACEVLSRV